MTIGEVAWDGVQLLAIDQRQLTHFNVHGNSIVVPGAAHIDGLDDSRWRTDIEVLNQGEESATCRLTLYEDGRVDPNRPTAEVIVPPGQARRLEDVVASVFGVVGKGSITVAPEGGLVHVAGWTFDDQESGTVGQYVPGWTEAEALRSYDDGRLPGLRHSVDPTVGFRTNIGVISVCPEPMTVELALFQGEEGEELGRLSLDLAPFESRQLNNVLATVTDQPVENGFAVLTTDHPRCAYHVFASIIDNSSGDPILVPAMAKREY